jgi:hypothetical protein
VVHESGNGSERTCDRASMMSASEGPGGKNPSESMLIFGERARALEWL